MLKTGEFLIEVKVKAEDGATRFVCRFDPRETHSVRLYLKGGHDRVVRGPDTSALTLRVIGGKGHHDRSGLVSLRYLRQARPRGGEELDSRARQGTVWQRQPVFAPRINSKPEDDGYLVSFIIDENAGTSECVLIDAANFDAGPVCRIALPHKICSGTHALWSDQPKRF